MSDCEFLVNDYFSETQIQVVYADHQQTFPNHLKDDIDQKWQQQLQQAEKSGNRLFDGELLRLDAFEYTEAPSVQRRLVLHLSKTRYRNFVCTNMLLQQRNGLWDDAFLANPLGLSALIICSDNKAILGLRGKGTFLYSGFWHTFGGVADTDDVDKKGGVRPFQVILREVTEELGIVSGDVTQMVCMGLVRDSAVLQPELIFRINIRQSSTDVLSVIHQPSASIDEEHDRIIAVNTEAAHIEDFIRTHQSRITPVAKATLRRYRTLDTAPGELEE
ncbi:MAG: hypothetical protein JXR76_24715 [Deltaproteobacteria bacterium]|nr:hypothetical protein [Deltaproteobacteria bacterium]